ncbi:MAG: peptidase S8 [Chloroflexi bacterium]|nr:MAG: peptidase S8 [Chloroflexota bacterium]
MNGRFLYRLLFIGLAIGLFQLATTATKPASSAPNWTTKVDGWVLETAESQTTTEFLVYLTEQADLSLAAAQADKQTRGRYVYQQLTAVARQTQPPILKQLAAMGAQYRPFWIVNMIWVRGDLSVIAAMAQRTDVAHLYANPTVKTNLPEGKTAVSSLETTTGIEWNLTQINAPDVWSMGFTGQGVIIGGQDTGYDWDHIGLINQYRGWNGTTADHNYNWHDAIHSGGGICGPDSPEPCDDYGHGTHTMGIMVGDDGTNQTGVAPGARWIGCRNMDVGTGTPGTYAECFQWFVAPTDLNDQNPDPDKAPHVINNSWSCPESEGCTDPNVLLAVVQNVRAAGIVTVQSAGNSGPTCSSINTPAAIYDESLTVGATDSNDNIASFSSRGPVTVDGSNRLKPDVSAPGVSIRATVPGNAYSSLSGTSMAAPHVAGLVALLISANPALAGQVDTIEGIIMNTAVPRTTLDGCGSDTSTSIPNNTYGYGRIDAQAAILTQLPHHTFLPIVTIP